MSTPVTPLRALGLLALAAALSACVVPVGPDWIDPEGNAPPTLKSAEPPVGTVLTRAPDGGEPMAVTVVLADRNTKDPLYVRFIIDYPPFEQGISQLAWLPILPGGGEVERPPLIFRPNCTNHNIAASFANHRLLLAASDGPFIDDSLILDQVPDGSFRVEAVWPFELECP